MPTVEERVTALETKMDGIADLRAELRTTMGDLRAELRATREEVRSDLRELRADMKAGFERVDRRFEVLDTKVDRHFVWVVGIQFALFISVIGVLLRAAFR